MHMVSLSAEHICVFISKPLDLQLVKNVNLSFTAEKEKQVIGLQMVLVLYKFHMNYFLQLNRAHSYCLQFF